MATLRADSSGPTLVYERPPAEHFGGFEVYEELGRGGLARRHRAVASQGRASAAAAPVVLERLRTNLAGDWELVNAFVQEAMLASQLRHRHLARTYTYGRIEGVYYCTSELVQGPTLREVMRQANTAAGAIPVPVVLALLVQITEVVGYLHAQSGRIIHRDLTPDNFIVAATGELKLVDLGLAKLPTRAPTRLGVLKGTPCYIAPEAASGCTDERADLFAIGVIAYELLTGTKLAPHDLEHVAPPSRVNPAVDPYLDDVVMLALAFEPTERWQHAKACWLAVKNLAFDLGEPDATHVRAWLLWAFDCAPRQSAPIRSLVDSLDAEFRRASG